MWGLLSSRSGSEEPTPDRQQDQHSQAVLSMSHRSDGLMQRGSGILLTPLDDSAVIVAITLKARAWSIIVASRKISHKQMM
eukprot:21224-Eustigmatos_ZCMA.PRE.1